MKKVLFATLLAVSATGVFAQSNINKGNWMVGGQGSFSYEKDGDLKTTEVEISPNVGYFFIDNLAAGLRLGVGSTTEKIGGDKETLSGFNVGPFVRYYFLPSSKKLNIFADGSFTFGQTKYDDGTTDMKMDYNSFGLMAGPAYFITPNVALEAALGWMSHKFDGADERTNSFGLQVGFQIHLGGAKK